MLHFIFYIDVFQEFHQDNMKNVKPDNLTVNGAIITEIKGELERSLPVTFAKYLFCAWDKKV